MAERQQPETGPILDNSYENDRAKEGVPGENKIVHAFRPEQLKSVIRIIRSRNIEEIKPLLTQTHATLKRLGVSRDLEENWPAGIPDGSDHFDFGTFKTWTEGITKEDADSIAQLVTIDATAKMKVIGG